MSRAPDGEIQCMNCEYKAPGRKFDRGHWGKDTPSPTTLHYICPSCGDEFLPP